MICRWLMQNFHHKWFIIWFYYWISGLGEWSHSVNLEIFPSKKLQLWSLVEYMVIEAMFIKKIKNTKWMEITYGTNLYWMSMFKWKRINKTEKFCKTRYQIVYLLKWIRFNRSKLYLIKKETFPDIEQFRLELQNF